MNETKIIILLSLAGGGVIYAIIISLIVWMETGKRRKPIKFVSRILLWGIGIPLTQAIAVMFAMFIAWKSNLDPKLLKGYLKIILYSSLPMAIIGIVAGFCSHKFLEHSR